MRKFLVSLGDVNLERGEYREWKELLRNPDWRIRARFTDRLKSFLDRLPPLEHDIIILYFFTTPQKKQEEIHEILNISQQAVSHRMYCAIRRLKFMMSQPEIDPARMRADLALVIKNKFTVDVLCDFTVTSSQTVTATNMSRTEKREISQQRICWHLNSGIRFLKEKKSIEALFYVDYFENLMRHRNILREVLAGRRRKDHVGPDERRYFDVAISSRGNQTEDGRTESSGPEKTTVNPS